MKTTEGPEGRTGSPALTDERPPRQRPRSSAADPGKTATAGGRAARRSRRNTWITIALFLLPGLVLFTLLVVVPILLAGYASFFKWNGFGILPTDFRGLDNFTRLFGDEIFLGDLWRGLVIIVLSLVLQLPLALGIALMLNQRMRGRALYRVIFFAPYVLSEVITGVLFSLMLAPDSGLDRTLLDMVGLEGVETAFLARPETVLPTLFVVMTWKYFGFHMILYLAGRQGIPEEVIEAAKIDGAGSWQTFRHVTLPLLGPTIRISIFLSVIGAIQLFDLVWVLTGGGPVHASETMAVTMFEYGFRRFQVGYASAISVVMFLISLVFAIGYQRFVMRRDTEGALTNMRAQR